MPQMNKGGKFIFGKSLIRQDNSIKFPMQAIDEFPAIEQSEELGKLSFLPAVTGFWLGILDICDIWDFL